MSRASSSGLGATDERFLLTVPEAAELLRTTRTGIYAMVARGSLPGVRRIGRRVLLSRPELVHWLDHNCASSAGSRR